MQDSLEIKEEFHCLQEYFMGLDYRTAPPSCLDLEFLDDSKLLFLLIRIPEGNSCPQIGANQWRYYDYGPKLVPPLICLPGTAGTADVYYKQIMSLSSKGYRVISVDIPCVWSHQEWVHSFEKFLDAVDVHHVHLYGTSLGGFLAQLFAQHRPRRVRSLVLSNAFLETRCFAAAMRWSSFVNWTPSFLLKRHILMGIHDGPHEPFIADSVDFVVCQLETLPREDLASRLTLNTAAASVGRLQLSDSCITIMDTNDYCAIPQQLKDQVGDRYPGARRAFLKTGGDFPFLSRPDEVNLHLQLHLRHVGLEARPDLVIGASRDGNAGSPPEERRQDEPPDDTASSDRGSKTNAEDITPPSGTETHVVDGQLLNTTRLLLAAKNSTYLCSLLLVFMERALLIGASELLFRPPQVSPLSPLITFYAGVLYSTYRM